MASGVGAATVHPAIGYGRHDAALLAPPSTYEPLELLRAESLSGLLLAGPRRTAHITDRTSFKPRDLSTGGTATGTSRPVFFISFNEMKTKRLPHAMGR